jgi:site-specific DNA recombinase
MMRAAIYARVSTQRQERNQTINSQITALRFWASEHGHQLLDEHIFKDEGYSGSRLDRPGLDRLRDAALDNAFEVLAVLSPDRLARKYAYQVILLEEFRRFGCEAVFLHHPISDDPNDQLLLQIQAAVAEYERALLGERFRRGKLQKARAGHLVGGKAAYGYTYIHKTDTCPSYLLINETEAEFVRQLYEWLLEEQLSIRQILKRLNAGPWLPRCGRKPWNASVVHHILADPIYTGMTYTNRYRFLPAKKPRKLGPHNHQNTCRQLKPREEWIGIPVPAIITPELYERAQAQLARNAKRSFRNNRKHSYLQRCLLSCGRCGLSMFGTTYKATATGPRQYYRCRGRDCLMSGRSEPCRRAAVLASELETAVWNHVVELMSHPDQLLQQFEEFVKLAAEGDARQQVEASKLRSRLSRLEKEESRLIDAYQAEVINLEELSSRRQQIERMRRALQAESEQEAKLRQQRSEAAGILNDLKEFCGRIHNRLQEASFEEKQTILQLLIERIMVGEDSLEIRHVIPLRETGPRQSGSGPPGSRLRSDGVKLAALPTHTRKNRHSGGAQPGMVIAGDQLHA